MREIEFRGKKENNGEWIEGFLSKSRNICGKLELCIDYEEKGVMCSSIVEAKSIGQYTGLTDKNGRKIFEGDIVLCDEKHIRYVVYSGIFTAFILMKYVDGLTSECFSALGRGYDNHRHTFEVLGNIHDNRDLLKSEGEFQKCRKQE